MPRPKKVNPDPTEALLEEINGNSMVPDESEQSEQPRKTPNPYAKMAAVQSGDTGGKDDMARLREVFFDHYPAFRPSYADTQVLMASVYAISVRGVLSSGQHKCLDAIERRCKQRGTW